MPSDFDSDYAYALGAVLGREDTVIEPLEIMISLDVVDIWWHHVSLCDMISDIMWYVFHVWFNICFLSMALLGVLSVMCTACSNSLQMFVLKT